MSTHHRPGWAVAAENAAGPAKRKPRLAFFRWTRAGLPAFLAAHAREQVTSLEQFFDVTVIDRDCDYGQVCDSLRPDLCVFESGVYAGNRAITNTSAHPDIPKLGFLHADAFDSSRAAFIADMARWGVSWFFTTSMSMAEYTPQIAKRLFVWPNAIDPNVFRDYQLAKNIPVLFTGSQAWHYPWRNGISRAVTPEFITMTMPHFGWGAGGGTDRMLHGADYARLLNASTFVPTCGTVARDVVRKHLEIPAAMACLVTERTASIEAFGFADMVNCVFAEEDDVVDKLQQLLRHPEELERVTRAGHDLVVEHHTNAQRSQVLQWFELVSQHGLDISLVQDWPDGRLRLAAGGENLTTSMIVSSGRDRQLIASGWNALQRGEYSDAQRDFLQSINYYFMPESAIGLAHAALFTGMWPEAHSWVSRTMTASMSYYGATEPDPVQWASKIRVLLCSGDLPAAADAAEQFAEMGHTELDRMRAAVATLTGRVSTAIRPAIPRASVCPPPPLGVDDWTRQLQTMLIACGQVELARGLRRESRDRSLELKGPVGRRTGMARGKSRVVAQLGRLSAGRTRSAPERWLRRRLSPLKRRLMTSTWSRYIGDFAQREPVSFALVVVGHDRASKSSRAVRRGLVANPEVRRVAAIESSDMRRGAIARPPTVAARVDMVRRAAEALSELDDYPRSLVFVTRGGSVVIEDVSILRRAATVIVEGTNEPSGQRILAELVGGDEHDLIDCRPEQGAGYAVFRRSTARRAVKGAE